MIALPARSSWPWRPFKRPSPENGEGPGAEAGAFRASPCTVIAVPGCTVPPSYHGPSLCLKYPGECEGERLALETSCPRQRAPRSRATELGGRTFGFALQTRARGPAAAVQRRRRAGVTGFGARESKLGFPHRKTLAGGRPRTPFRPSVPDGEGRTVADLQVRAVQARPRISAPRPLTRRRP